MLVDPIVGAGGRFFPVFVDVDLEALAIAFVLPVSDVVANVVQERTAAEVGVRDKDAAEVAEMDDIVSAGDDGGEKFDGTHYGHVRTHRDVHRKGEKPDATVWKEDSIGHQDTENRPRGADGGNQRGLCAEEHGNRLDDYLDEPRARST